VRGASAAREIAREVSAQAKKSAAHKKYFRRVIRALVFIVHVHLKVARVPICQQFIASRALLRVLIARERDARGF